MTEEQACEIAKTWREPLRMRLSRYAHAVARPIYLYVYCRFIYRHHMRLIHRFGWHWMKRHGPMYPDGGVFHRCDWCGKHESEPSDDDQ